MREENRRRQRRRLDVEMGPFRRAAMDKHPTNDLLRSLRRALGIRAAELAAKLGVVESVVFAHELSEVKNTIQINTLSGVAEAMGCKVIYGIVPIHGQTLEELASEIYVQRVLKARERSAANTEQLTAVGSDGTDIGPGTGVQEEVARDQGGKPILYLPLPR